MSLFPNNGDKNMYYKAAWNLLIRIITGIDPGETYDVGQGVELLEKVADKQNPYKEQLSDILYNGIENFINGKPNIALILRTNVPLEEVCAKVGTVTNIIASAIENGHTIDRVNKQLDKQIEQLAKENSDFPTPINIDGELVKDFNNIEKTTQELKFKMFGKYLEESGALMSTPQNSDEPLFKKMISSFERKLISDIKQDPKYQEQREKIESIEKQVIKDVLDENSKKNKKNKKD